MKKHTLRFLVYGSILTVAIASPFMPRSLVQQYGLDVWAVPELEAQIKESEAECAELDTEVHAVLDRIDEKEALVRELLYGHNDLLTVARRFRAMHANDAVYASLMHARFPNHNNDERICLKVIEYAERLLPARPELASAVSELKRQFESLRLRGRGVGIEI